MIGHGPTYLVFFRDERAAGSPLTPYEATYDNLESLIADMGQYESAEEVWCFHFDGARPENLSEEVAEAIEDQYADVNRVPPIILQYWKHRATRVAAE